MTGHQQAQLETPQRSAILSVLYFCEKKELPCSYKDLHEAFGFSIATNVTSSIVKNKRARRLQNSDDPDNRGALRELTNSDANAIATYIDEALFEEKGDPWVDLAYRAGVEFPKGRAELTRQIIQRRVTEVSGIKSHKAAVKEAVSEDVQKERVRWSIYWLVRRPHGVDWRNVIWCDELHWSTGPKHVKYIKRRPGKDERFKPGNIQYQKDARKDPQKRKWFHIYTVIGYNFVWCTPYNAGNSNGKMNARTYLTILPKLLDKIRGKELVLYQDGDSAHTSKAVVQWMERHGMDTIVGPPLSPDLSVMETWVKPLHDKFPARRCTTAEEGVQRFYKVFYELNQEKVKM